MKTRTTALLSAGLLLTGTVFLTGCNDTPLPQMPGVEEQDGGEEQGENGDQDNEKDDD
ncbi:hypothetical protein [Arthrobacter sp. CAN_C5]|uniref:hypothetical protein n=1 Tax=Arthrobacter sp. CAN_C5 TaxID=2760706 RepID=UPI001AE1DA61|nr:hypothetical protein [Arthrobacter sp. CAN_C5]MBP2217343.1 hypothetical protein [Arthrobacter sp. CAN_C5]